MAKPLDNRPFNHNIKPEVGIDDPKALPFILIKKIYKEMEKDKLQTLKERYEKAFKICVDVYVKNKLIAVRDNMVFLTGAGQAKEVKEMSGSDAVIINIKFNELMSKLAAQKNSEPPKG